jgi:glucokinase
MTKDVIVGVDLGGTTIKMAIVDADHGNVINRWEIPTNTSDNGKYIVNDMALSIKENLNQYPELHILGIGIGAPGPVINQGTIKEAVNLGWKNFPLKELMEKELQKPVYVENDANCAALGEMWKGAGRNSTNIVCLTLGTGVGGGVIINGDIVQGVGGGGGEIGHMPVQFDDSFQCNCGKKGCLETVASATGIVNIFSKLEKEYSERSELKDLYTSNGKISTREIFDYAKKGDSLAKQVVEKASSYLGIAIANLAAILNPEKVILGGGVSNAGNILIETVEKFYSQYAFPPTKNDTKIVLAELGNDAGILGACWLVKKNQ